MRMREIINIVEGQQILDEMPITTSFQGTEGPGSFRDDDRKLIASEKGQANIARVWKNSIVDFHIVYLNRDVAPENSTEAVKNRYGPITSKELKDDFGAIVKPSKDAITIVFSHNEGNERVPLTGWIIAHRAYHIFEEAYRNGNEPHAWPPRNKHPRIAKPYKATYDFMDLALHKFRQSYFMADDAGNPTSQRAFPASGVGNCMGTTKAARDKNLADFGEVKHEAFAQYVLTGSVKFNNPPDTYEGAGRTFIIDPEKKAELTEFVHKGQQLMTDSFIKLLSYAKGKIFLL